MPIADPAIRRSEVSTPIPPPTPPRASESTEPTAKSALARSDANGGDTATANDEEGDIIVDWDGPDDPANPRNWTLRRKWAATVIVSAFTFISPVSSSMVAPASEQIAQQFGITSTVVLAMTVSIFVLAYAIGPLILGPLSEIFGRSRVLQLANVWYLIWNLVCGWSNSTGELIAFRFLAGLGGSAPLAIGGGVLGDLFDPTQRGQAIAIYSLAPLLGPVVGPVAGAWIAERSTWRWVFWSTSIVDGIIQIAGIFFLQETYVPILLERKAAAIRKELYGSSAAQASPLTEPSKQPVEDAEKKPARPHRLVRTKFESPDRHWRTIVIKGLTRPFYLFGHEPIIQLLGIYMAFIYGLLYIFLTNIPIIFSDIYHESVGIGGLNYLALGVGLSGASQINARTLDKVYKKLSARNGGRGRPEFRLPSMVPGTLIVPVGLLLTGWSVQNHLHWIAADIGIALVGAGTILSFQCIQTYVIDAFTLHAASALAAVSCLRSLAGFGFPLFAPAMYNALGYGKGNTILAALAIAIGCPAPWLFWTYGERIRKASKHARDP